MLLSIDDDDPDQGCCRCCAVPRPTPAPPAGGTKLFPSTRSFRRFIRVPNPLATSDTYLSSTHLRRDLALPPRSLFAVYVALRSTGRSGDPVHQGRGRRVCTELPKWGGSILSMDRAKYTKAMNLYGRRCPCCTSYRARPRQTPQHPLACSTAHGLSAGMYITGGWRERISRARAIPANILLLTGEKIPKNDLQPRGQCSAIYTYSQANLPGK